MSTISLEFFCAAYGASLYIFVESCVSILLHYNCLVYGKQSYTCEDNERQYGTLEGLVFGLTFNLEVCTLPKAVTGSDCAANETQERE